MNKPQQGVSDSHSSASFSTVPNTESEQRSNAISATIVQRDKPGEGFVGVAGLEHAKQVSENLNSQTSLVSFVLKSLLAG